MRLDSLTSKFRGFITYASILTIIFSSSCTPKSSVPTLIESGVAVAQVQYTKAIESEGHNGKIPRTYNSDGSLNSTGVYSWTSGFFAGNMWYMYELTGDDKWKSEAIYYTEILDTIQYWTGNHDVGFMINCSYGNGLRLTDNSEHYRDILVNTAKSLSTRFNTTIGCLESWNYRKAWDNKTEWFFPVIIDNMMNLELLFEASIISGDNSYRDIAVTHANTTMKNHYRDDFSCYHVIDYSEETGEVKDRATCQGYSDNSSWARGQAWGLYGYVLCYRYTKDIKYLEFAENIANYIITNSNLQEDKIPLWDYHVGMEGYTPEWDYDATKFKATPRDVSAAMITVSALLELAEYSSNSSRYIEFSKETLTNVESGKYMATAEDNNFFILKESVGSIPHGAEISVPLNYADYYFLEALVRVKKLESK